MWLKWCLAVVEMEPLYCFLIWSHHIPSGSHHLLRSASCTCRQLQLIQFPIVRRNCM